MKNRKSVLGVVLMLLGVSFFLLGNIGMMIGIVTFIFGVVSLLNPNENKIESINYSNLNKRKRGM